MTECAGCRSINIIQLTALPGAIGIMMRGRVLSTVVRASRLSGAFRVLRNTRAEPRTP